MNYEDRPGMKTIDRGREVWISGSCLPDEDGGIAALDCEVTDSAMGAKLQMRKLLKDAGAWGNEPHDSLNEWYDNPEEDWTYQADNGYNFFIMKKRKNPNQY